MSAAPNAPALFGVPKPKPIDGIELILGDTTEAIDRAAALGGATLIIADPPWGEYDLDPGSRKLGEHYGLLDLDTIHDHVIKATDQGAKKDARYVLWATWPLLPEAFSIEPAALGWQYKTGGAWQKGEHFGLGYHWRGNSEPVLVWLRGKPPNNTAIPLKNAHYSDPGEHSAKPELWMAKWLERWTDPGDLVLDLYAGLGSVARSCRETGRRYVGAEIDPERHRQAMAYIAQNKRLVE